MLFTLDITKVHRTERSKSLKHCSYNIMMKLKVELKFENTIFITVQFK